MKGFPAKVDGPLGPWYKKVNEALARVQIGEPKQRLIELLGEPDEVRPGNNHPGRELQEVMEGVAGGPTLIPYGSQEPYDELLVYLDPYRSRRHYIFAINDSSIAQFWPVTGP